MTGRRPFIWPGVAAARAERQRSEYGAPSALRGHGDSRASRHPWPHSAARQIRSAAMRHTAVPSRRGRGCGRGGPARCDPGGPTLRSSRPGGAQRRGAAAEWGRLRKGRSVVAGPTAAAGALCARQRVLGGPWRPGKTGGGVLATNKRV